MTENDTISEVRPEMSVSMSRVFSNIIQVIFGKYLGVQVFIAPVTLFYLLQSSSVLEAGTSLFGFHLHYFPLLAFSVMLCFTLFMLLKMKLIYHYPSRINLDLFIELNISVLGLVIIALIIYAVSSFLAYFYGIRGTGKSAFYLLFKLYTTVLVIYHYLLSVFLEPYTNRHYGRHRGMKAFMAWARQNKLFLARYALLLVLIVIASTRIYQIAIEYALSPLISWLKDLTGVELRFRLIPFFGIVDIFRNVLICLLAFCCSNMLFSPIVYLIDKLVKTYIPFGAFVKVEHAKATQ